ncbi:MAG: hypothetical protein AAF687_02210 [Pseudomonadota bacterium]
MPRLILASLAVATATVAVTPLAAHDRIYVDGARAPIAPNNDSNKWYRDFRTDISEAKRELRSDLRRATDAEDRRDAYDEYHNEIADAKKDYRKEMAERGYRVVSFKRNNRRFARR